MSNWNSSPNQIRKDIIELAYKASQCGIPTHISSALSCVEIYCALFGEIFNYNDTGFLDEFYVSKEHASLTQYIIYEKLGILPQSCLTTYMQDGNILLGHPMIPQYGLTYSSGSLGMATSYAVGRALSQRQDRTKKIYVLIGDGELQEGIQWESFMCASHYGLENYCLIVDCNKLQLEGKTEDIVSLGDLKAKFEAFGFYTKSVDGHNLNELVNAFQDMHIKQPMALIANTIKGKGVSYMEGNPKWHQGMINPKQYIQAMEELETTDESN